MDEDGEGRGFAEAIRAWRKRRGLTQEELSHASGLSTRAIRSMESGRTLRPRRTTVQMLADALQVPRARLMATVRRNPAEEPLGGERPGDDPVRVRERERESEAAPEAADSLRNRPPRELPPEPADDEAAPSGGAQAATSKSPAETNYRPVPGETSPSAGAQAATGRSPADTNYRAAATGTSPSARAQAATSRSPAETNYRAVPTEASPSAGAQAAISRWPAETNHRSVSTGTPPSPDVAALVAELRSDPGARRARVVIVPDSALAIRAAHRAAADFPDGQLYADLGSALVPAADILRRFLRSLGVADRPGYSAFATDELAAALRSALAGRRVLILVDNAASEAQIKPLVPAEPRCALVVVKNALPR